MKLLVEIDYLPNVIGVDPLTHLKGAIEKCSDGVKVLEIYKSAKASKNPILKSDGTKDNEVLIMESVNTKSEENIKNIPNRFKSSNTTRTTQYDERIISDHGKWKSYDDPDLIPTIEM